MTAFETPAPSPATWSPQSRHLEQRRQALAGSRNARFRNAVTPRACNVPTTMNSPTASMSGRHGTLNQRNAGASTSSVTSDMATTNASTGMARADSAWNA